MTPAPRLLALLAALASVLSFQPASAQPEGSADRSLSPYFFVKSDDPTVDRLPLKSTTASVQISGVIADVLVTQVYANEGKRPLEATYIFPASTRAAEICSHFTGIPSQEWEDPQRPGPISTYGRPSAPSRALS